MSFPHDDRLVIDGLGRARARFDPSPMVRKLSHSFDMISATGVRVLALAVAVGCSRPDVAPAQSDGAAERLAKSRDASVRAAASMIGTGRPWRATEIVDSTYPAGTPRSPEVMLASAVAAAGWSGWARVEKELASALWLDSLF